MDTEMWWNSPKWPWLKTKLPSCATVYSSVSMNICNIYICKYIYIYIYYTCIPYLCIYVSMYLCIYVSMYLCIYVSMYLCIYVCLYIYIYIWTCVKASTSAKKNIYFLHWICLWLSPLDLAKVFLSPGTLPYHFFSGLMVAPPTEAAIKIWTILSVHSVQPACVHVMGTRFAGDTCIVTWVSSGEATQFKRTRQLWKPVKTVIGH